MYNINFLASAYDDNKNYTYSNFLIPFAFFALLTNKNSHVELIVENINDFNKKYKNEINMLMKFNNNFLIRCPTFKRNKHIPNTYRFFEKPHVDSEYTYISDIDIMFLETEIVDKYKLFWPDNLPYNNILRLEDSVRLTGVHMIRTKDYFTEEFIKFQQKRYKNDSNENDEVVLGEMCKKVFGLPDFSHRVRPIYGIHFSPNRGINKKMELGTTQEYYDKYMEIKSKYPEIFDLKIFKNLTNQLENEFIV
jgi:hypothetical protein